MSLVHPLKRSAPDRVWNNQDSGEDDPEQNEQQIKKTKYSWYVTLESEGTSEDESDTESTYSVQEQETEFARDTSDSSTSTWISTSHADVSLHVEEYELASSSESDDHPFLDSLSTSDPEEMSSQRMFIELDQVNPDLADDSDDSRTTTSIDSEIGRADYWTCVQCNMNKNNPLFRFCEKCFQLRKNFYPPRPRRRRKRTKVDQLKADDKHSSQETTGQSTSQDVSRCDSQESTLTRGDSGLGSSQGSQSICEAESKETDGAVLRESSSCSTLRSNESDVEFIESKIENLRKKAIEDPDNKYCLMCTVRPKDGAFAHGTNLHICCCYKCAVKTWKTTKYCPICNRKVTNVFKVFIV